MIEWAKRAKILVATWVLCMVVRLKHNFGNLISMKFYRSTDCFRELNWQVQVGVKSDKGSLIMGLQKKLYNCIRWGVIWNGLYRAHRTAYLPAYYSNSRQCGAHATSRDLSSAEPLCKLYFDLHFMVLVNWFTNCCVMSCVTL